MLDLCDVKVNESCGLHVHIDAAGFSMETWRNLALSYKHLEPVIDRFMPASRRDNYYCRGLGHVSDGMIRSARTVDELKGRIGDRYHKVNLEPTHGIRRSSSASIRERPTSQKCVTGCCFSTNWLPLPQGDRYPQPPHFRTSLSLTVNRNYIIN